MTSAPHGLPLAARSEPVRYVLIDDEPAYRLALNVPGGVDLELAGSYGTVEAFLAIQRRRCHVVVLDLCLNRQTGDKALLQGVRAIRQLADCGHQGYIVSEDLHQALRQLAASCADVRLSGTLEATLAMLESGMSDVEFASRRNLSARTIEDHKRKILEIFGATCPAIDPAA